MGWETRNGKGRYYTRSRREGGRVVREYLGSGELAECLASLNGARQKGEREQFTQQQTEANELAGLVTGFYADVEREMQAAFTAAGYHRHSRGRWRKRRTTDAKTIEGEQ